MTKEQAIEILKKLDYLLDDVYSTGLVEDEERNKYQYAIESVLSMLEEKELALVSLQKMHNYDLKMIDYVKGEAIRLYNQIAEKDKIIEDIIKRLDNDTKRITNTLKDSKHSDDYSKCRLKAYRTKTKELKDYINSKYFGEDNCVI